MKPWVRQWQRMTRTGLSPGVFSRWDFIWAIGELGVAAVIGATFGMIVAWYVYGY